MPTVKDHAVVIRMLDWSESSQIVVLMTERHGKVSATAKGAKRTTPSTLAKFSGGIELLTAGEAVLIIKPTTDLANLIEWNLTDSHWHLRSGLRAYGLAMYAADLVHHVVQDHDPHPATYVALRALLSGLADAEHVARQLLRFQWTVLLDGGFKPELHCDAQTGEALDDAGETLAFSASAGGLVADTGSSDRWRVRRSTVDLLRRVASDADIDDADEATVDRANRLMCVYFRAILDRELPTMYALLGE